MKGGFSIFVPMNHVWSTLLLLALLTMGQRIAAQAEEISFEAFADARQVALGSNFSVTFTLRNAWGSNPQLPNWIRDFMVVETPMVSSRTTIINGQPSSAQDFTYILRPRRKGTFTIGSASVEVKGQRYRSAPLVIEVVDATTIGTDSGADYFLRAEISDATPYEGQQLILDYNLYTTYELDARNSLQESDYAGFFVQAIRRFDSRPVREVINGREYTVYTLKRLALYPLQVGRLTISPYEAMLGFVVDRERNDSYFSRARLRQEKLATEPLTVEVKPLPEPRPADFSGAVGDFNLSSELNQTNISTDDALSLQLRITGIGDIKRIRPPALTLPAGLEVYEPRTVAEEWLEGNDEVRGYKELEYVIVPQRAGEYQFVPTLSYFNTDSAQYVQLTAVDYAVTVTPGSRTVPVVTPSAPTLNDDSTGLRPFIRDIRLRQPSRATWFRAGWFWGAALLPLLLLMGVWTVRRYRSQRASIDPQLRRQARARTQAEQRLRTASRYQQQGDAVAFYDEIGKALFDYAADKLQLPTAELTKDRVRQELTTRGVSAGLVGQFIQLLQASEAARYGGVPTTDNLADTYRQATSTLVAIEQALDPRS